MQVEQVHPQRRNGVEDVALAAGTVRIEGVQACHGGVVVWRIDDNGFAVTP